MGGPRRYCEYRRPLWPWEWIRWWVARWRQVSDRSDGRVYVGWTARITRGEQGLPPVSTEGRIVAADIQGGELAHRIEFPDHVLTAPLPWPGIELIEPGR